MDTYEELREKIEDRIEEIENYYEYNFDKPNSKYFEKGRMKLKKLLMYEPSTVNEMYLGENNQKNAVLIINDTNKNTIEDNLSNNYNNDDDNENKENLLNKQIHLSSNKKKKVKPKFIPLKEKKWKKNLSAEIFYKNKNIDSEEENKRNFHKYAFKNSLEKNHKNNNIFINKQSNLYIKNNYNLYEDYKKNKSINKYKK
jgi:hypothetical protein